MLKKANIFEAPKRKRSKGPKMFADMLKKGKGKRKQRGAKPDFREFRNPALQNVWSMAAVAGFDEAELKNLKRELMEHQSKVQQHRVSRRNIKDPNHPDLEDLKIKGLGFKEERDAFHALVRTEAKENGKGREVELAAGKFGQKKQQRSKNVLKQKQRSKTPGPLKQPLKQKKRPKIPSPFKRKGRGGRQKAKRNSMVDERIIKLQELLKSSNMPEEERAEYDKGLADFAMANEALKVERTALKTMHMESRKAAEQNGKGKDKGMAAGGMKHFAEGRKKISDKHRKLGENLSELEKTIRKHGMDLELSPYIISE